LCDDGQERCSKRSQARGQLGARRGAGSAEGDVSNATPAELQFVADIAALAIGIDLINRGIPKESVAPMPRYGLIAHIQARIVVIAQLARLHAFHTAMLASDLAMLVPLPR
jgi:hypothetical protein